MSNKYATGSSYFQEATRGSPEDLGGWWVGSLGWWSVDGSSAREVGRMEGNRGRGLRENVRHTTITTNRNLVRDAAAAVHWPYGGPVVFGRL